ncbi:MAG: conjugal transfer protein TraN [Desulfobacterales bacterium]|nr:conjugal transfer protein TraN [Desulfobacterales bacterium]
MIYLIALVCCMLAVYAVHADEAEMGRNAGIETGDSIRLQLDSADKINDRVAQPLTSDGTPMKTFGPENEQQSFNAQLTAPSSDAFLEVFVQPAASGDLAGASVSQDTDFDGNTDYVYNVPVQISGVCANGVISCDVGTWSHCTYYRWTANDNLEVSLNQKDSITDLAACYCINSSCGSQLVWDNLDLILKDLGGGVVAAVQSKNPHCTITNVSIDGPVIRYYGQETDELGSGVQGVYSSGTPNPEQYYEAGSLPVDAEVAGQMNEPDSYYSQLNDVYSTQPQTDFVSCTITNDIVPVSHNEVVDVQMTVWYDSTTAAATDRVKVTSISPIGNTYDWSAGLENHFGDLGYEILRRAGLNVNSVEQDDLDTFNKTAQFWWMNYPQIHGPCNMTLTCETVVSILEHRIQNSCHPDASCRLKEEKVCDAEGLNCVQTWQHFNPTSQSPLPTCKGFSAIEYEKAVHYTACMDGVNATVARDGGGSQILASGDDMWWRVERVYSCQADGEYDFDNVLQRTRHIRDTEQDNTVTLYYEDYDPETGLATPRTTDLPERSAGETCEKACKLRKPVEDTEAGVPGTTADYRTTVNSYTYVYRKCEGDVCPVEDGEEIVKDCACLNDFGEAASVMQVLDDAGDDLICTEYNQQGNCIGQIYIFSGSDSRCRSDGLTIGFDNCCKDDEYWFGLGQCREDERQLATSKAEGLCHYIGRYCSEEFDLLFGSICIEHSRTYCCFNSELSRMVHEQGRPQLQGDISSWGGPESPNCRGFTPEEFQMLDFSRIDLSEWYGDIEAKGQDQIENEMQESIENHYEKIE